jgi:hypothetical protein
MDLIMNGQAQGSVASRLLNNGFDVGLMRPFIGKDGREYMTTFNAETGKPETRLVGNAGATLRFQEWKQIDDAVVMSARRQMRVVADIRGAGLTYGIPNGMGRTVLVTQSMTDITDATISMDPALTGENDRPEFDLVNLPLPVVHKDFSFNARQIATSRNNGTPIDVSMAELAAKRVAEEIEKLTLGVLPTYTYGGGTIYGMTNFPPRITQNIMAPTDSGWTPQRTVADILSMRQSSINRFYYGPWMIYNAPDWDQYLDEDYFHIDASVGTQQTLRERILKIQGVQDIRTAHFLGNGIFDMIMIQMTSDVVRMVMGMDITTLQWETLGGLQINFKVMGIIVPQFRSTVVNIANHAAGIVHGIAV